MGIAHIRLFARSVVCAAAVAACLAGLTAAPAAAAMPTQCEDPFFSLDGNVCRADPVGGALGDHLGSSGAPDDDLLQALTDLGAAPDADAVARARGRALAILEGDAAALAPGDEAFLDAKAYRGIPLLNTKAKVQDDLPAGATVDIREVRFGDHALLDTSMLRFRPDAMDTPFTIRWHVTELGTSFGGELSPAFVPKAAAGQGELTLAQPLVAGVFDTGTTAINRFHPAGIGEETRSITQGITVQMPAPATISAVLDPNLKPGHETFAQVAVGSTADPEPAMPDAGSIAARSPERMIHRDLTALEPDAIEAAREIGTADAALVGQMRSRDTLPAPDAVVAGADINVQFANAEAYVSRREMRLAPDTKPDGSVEIAVTNLDTGAPRTFAVRELRDRAQKFGVDDWGRFQTGVLDTVTVGGGETKTVTVHPDPSAYSLWLGDPAGGDQAAMAVALDRGPRTQTLEIGEGGIFPLHQALDRDGNIWVTLEGNDEVMRLTPSADRLDTRDPEPARFPLPGGISANPPADGAAVEPVFGPADVAIDGQGMIWVTLVAGNAIARIDPSVAEPGRTDGKGIKIYDLAPCDRTCRTPPGPATPGPLSRFPLQMKVHEDGAGNTVIFFTEQMADRIGVLRVSPSGTKLNEQHYNCACAQPLGIALDPDGAVWFSEGSSNRLGKLTLGQARPYADDGHRIEHYVIPNPVEEFVPGEERCVPPPGDVLCAGGALPNPANTALPHSVAVDRRGRVWYTGEANERIGYLDPAKAKPNTSEGFVDTEAPVNEFGRALAPADLTFDRAGKGFFSDEYGDQIASATVRPDGSIEAERALRPSARNSLTDSPLVDDKGNLWFIESGANVITRVSDVTAGLPRPTRSPLVTANTATGRLTASGLVEMDAADVRVIRGGTQVARADAVPVTDGGFEVTLPLRADDRVQIVPRGGANPPAAFSFVVASLTASVGADGAVTGAALAGGRPLADHVTIDAGGGPLTAGIDISEGTYRLTGSLNPATAKGTVSWTAGSVSARFRTITPFGPAGGGGENPGGGSAGGGTGASAAPPAAPRGPAPSIPATPPGTTSPRPGGNGGSTDAACTTSRWLTRTGSGRRARRTLPLLGLSAADARRCLGRPARTRGRGRAERWTYTGSVELRLSRGRVTGFTLLGRRLRSAPDRAAVGTSVASFRRALGRLARSGRGYRGLVALGRDSYADIRLRTRSGRITRVTVTVRRTAALDRTARRLARSTR